MNGIEKRELPWWQKYTLTLNEASEYFGIGYKKLKMFVQEHSDEDFILWNGNRALIAYSARTAHPFRRNGAPFRFKLSKAQLVD